MEFKDYAQYYIGCRCFNTWYPENHPEYDKQWKLDSVIIGGHNPYRLDSQDGKHSYTWTDSIKPILRRLIDATPEEIGEMRLIRDSFLNRIKKYAAVTKYLTSIGIDVFELIENGLAIDSKTLKQTV